MILPQSFRSRAVLTGAALYLLVSLLCTRVPLVNYLGFEFSVVTAVLATMIAGILCIGAVRTSYRRIDTVIPDVAGTFGAFDKTLMVNLALLTIPLVVMVLNALVVRNCSILEGLGFFFLIPAVTVIFSCSLGFFCAVHYRFARTAYLLCVVVTLAYAVAVGYWTPAIFSYNFFYGYFPGLTYDEILRLRRPLVIFRGMTLFVALLLVLMARITVRAGWPGDPVWRKWSILFRELGRGHRRLFTVGAAGVLAVFYIFRCDLGLESTASYIQRVLGASVSTEHMTIYYDSSSFTVDEMRWVAAEHEFCLDQAWNAFVLPHRGRVASYIYPSADTKLRLIGAGATNIAKPWSKEIHITRQSLDATLKHELIHVVAGVFGLPIIRASLSPGLVEGIPMALEGDWGTRTVHEFSAAIRRAGIMPDVQRLMTIEGFATQSSSVSYVLVGSFCRYLIDRFGIRKLAQVYGHGNYEAAYGRTLGQLLTEWYGFLDRLPERPGDVMMVDASFRRPPIFGKICARAIADRNEQAREHLAAKEYRRAEELFSASYAEGGSYEGFSGWLVSALREGKFNLVTAVYDTVIAVDARPAKFLPLFLIIGDAFWAEGKLDRALVLYDNVYKADISRSFNEASICRSLAINNPHHDALRRLTLSDAHDSVRIALLDSLSLIDPGDILVQFLRGRTLLRLQRYDDALKILQGFDIGGTDARLETSRRVAIGQALFRLRRFQEAKAAFWESLNGAYSEGARTMVERWVERCDWMSRHGLQ